MKILITALISGLIIGLAVIWFGVYNVAANDKHSKITYELLELVRNRSISVRSDLIKVPDLDNELMIKEGATHYAEMCTGCHLAPGMETTELHSGLYPTPPVFTDDTYQNNSAAQFWVIKNGLKMTAMPSWAPAHTDEQIWAMVAFIKKLKTLSPEQYNVLIKQTANKSDHDNGHSHSH